eukprot:9067855-Lingulodinium_polyedra.AAC.1
MPGGPEAVGRGQDTHPPVERHSLCLAPKGLLECLHKAAVDVLLMPAVPPAQILQDVGPVVDQERVEQPSVGQQAVRGLLRSVEKGRPFPGAIIHVEHSDQQEDKDPQPAVCQPLLDIVPCTLLRGIGIPSTRMPGSPPLPGHSKPLALEGGSARTRLQKPTLARTRPTEGSPPAGGSRPGPCQ